MRIERRLEQSAILWLRGNPTLNALPWRDRDAVGPITPPGEKPTATYIVAARDMGRVGLTPFRRMDLVIGVRANVKADGITEEVFDQFCDALEEELDTANMQTALTNANVGRGKGTGIAVMLARRNGGIDIAREKLIRTASWHVDVRAIGLEHTLQA